MAKRKEGQETNWWTYLHIKFEKTGKGYVSFKLGKMEYVMKYETFLKIAKQLSEDYRKWKVQRGRKNENKNHL